MRAVRTKVRIYSVSKDTHIHIRAKRSVAVHGEEQFRTAHEYIRIVYATTRRRGNRNYSGGASLRCIAKVHQSKSV